MTRLLQAALLTTGIGLVHVAPASAQMILQLDAAIPPGMVEALKQYGIELPQDRVRGAVHIQQGADGSLDVRFNSERNGNYRHGRFTSEAIEERRALNTLIKMLQRAAEDSV